MNKLLTVIIPAYNTEKYILRCLQSLDHPMIDVIVVNDGSTDGTKELLDSFCDTHKNFRVIHTDNCGAPAARLTGLKEVKTKYFSFVDSDDYVNLDKYISLCFSMDFHNFKIGNGRMTVYLPGLSIPFNSRNWKKENVNFKLDKREFSNVSCSLLDKIWHSDLAHLFMVESKQKVYEDLEFVYYVLAKEGKMLHTNDIVYNYCMRGLSGNSTSALGLQMTKVDGIAGLLSATTSMKNKFMNDSLYEEYSDELDSITIKLVYQRIFNILRNKHISNKKEMAELVLQVLHSYIPNWQENKYYLEKFKGSEYNDYLFYLATQILFQFYDIDPSISPCTLFNYEELLKEYNKKLILK